MKKIKCGNKIIDIPNEEEKNKIPSFVQKYIKKEK